MFHVISTQRSCRPPILGPEATTQRLTVTHVGELGNVPLSGGGARTPFQTQRNLHGTVLLLGKISKIATDFGGDFVVCALLGGVTTRSLVGWASLRIYDRSALSPRCIALFMRLGIVRAMHISVSSCGWRYLARISFDS